MKEQKQDDAVRQAAKSSKMKSAGKMSAVTWWSAALAWTGAEAPDVAGPTNAAPPKKAR